MVKNLINEIEQAMLGSLNNEQLAQLRKVLDYTFRNIVVTEKDSVNAESNNQILVENFISAKKVEGCSPNSIAYYRSTINNALIKLGKEVIHITTDDLRHYLNTYQSESGASKVMLRRIIAFWGDLSLCSRPHFAALRLLYLTLQATVQVAYLIINIIELQFSPCTFLLPIREIFIPFPGFSRYDVPFTNHFLSSFHCFFVGFPCFPLRKCIAIPLFHYATFCFRMSDLLNTSVSVDSSKTVRLVIIVCT